MKTLFLSLLFASAALAQLSPISVPNAARLTTTTPTPGRPVLVEGGLVQGDGRGTGGWYIVTNISGTNIFVPAWIAQTGGLLTGASSLAQLQDLNWYPVSRRHAGQVARLTTGAEYTLGSDLTSWYNSGSVSNMAQLRSIAPGAGGTVYVDSYYGTNAFGGGTYTLTNSISGTNAFGGMVLALGGTNSWQIVGDNGNIDPFQFGAIGDGVTDSGPSIQATFEYAKPVRGMIRFQPGTYITSGSLVVDGGPFSISGQPGNNANQPAFKSTSFSSQVYIRLANGANTNVLWVTTNGIVTVDGIAFDGNRDNQTIAHPVLYIDGTAYPILQFNNCNFTGGSGQGAFVNGRNEVTFSNSKFLFNNLDGLYVTNQYDLILDTVQSGFNRGSGITLRRCGSSRMYKVDVFSNQNQGMDLNNFFAMFITDLVSNYNGREALKIQNTGVGLTVNGAYLISANQLYELDGFGGWTNASPTGTFPLLGFYDDNPDNPNGVYMVNLSRVFFAGRNPVNGNGRPSYMVGDFRTNSFARDGFGISINNSFLSRTNDYVTGMYTSNFPGTGSLKDNFNFGLFARDDIITARTWIVRGATNQFIGNGSNVFAVVNPTIFGTNLAVTTNLYVDTINGRTYVQGYTTDPPTEPASYPSGTTFVVKNNRLSTDRARVSVVGGFGGFSGLDLGSAGNSSVLYDEANNRLRFITSFSETFRIKLDQVVMGTGGTVTDPDNSSAVEIQSVNKGFRLPQMAGDPTFINTNTPNGMLWYRTDLNEFRSRATNETRILAQRLSSVSTVIDWPSLNTLQSTSTNVPYSNAQVGDYVILTPTQPNAGVIATADITGLGTVTITVNNVSSGAIDLGSSTFKVAIIKP